MDNFDAHKWFKKQYLEEGHTEDKMKRDQAIKRYDQLSDDDKLKLAKIQAMMDKERSLKERIDPNSEIADYVKGMFDSSVYDYEGIQSDVWSKAEYAATSPGEGSVFMDLVDYLKSVGGKDVLEGDPDVYLKLLPNEDIQWKAEIILNPQDDLRYLKENRLYPNYDDIIELIKSNSNKNSSSEIDEAINVMEFIGQHYGINIEFTRF